MSINEKGRCKIWNMSLNFILLPKCLGKIQPGFKDFYSHYPDISTVLLHPRRDCIVQKLLQCLRSIVLKICEIVILVNCVYTMFIL